VSKRQPAAAQASAPDTANDGRVRAIIEGVKPQVDGGRFAIKRAVGQSIVVEADVFTDGHDAVRAELCWRRADDSAWKRAAMKPLGNDRFRAQFAVDELGRYVYTVEGWVDHLLSWRQELARRVEAEDIASALLQGAVLIDEAAARANAGDAQLLRAWAQELRGTQAPVARQRIALDEERYAVAARYPDRTLAARQAPELDVIVDPPLAAFSAWYEFFPRSCAPEPGKHGTFRDCEARLRYAAQMGFDIVYVPPIHPIGTVKRKGPNNTLDPGPDAPGSPWAIGSAEGGHTAVHPQLGTLEDFRQFVRTARELHLEIALDIAFQSAPDHPFVQAHPQWFRHRPDGSVQYAENPPKKYQDIYPFDFESGQWRELWQGLADVFRFWVNEGVTVFRVDNPHTKPFTFWEWAIGELKREHPQLIFLAEAFTRPKVMHRLAKLGFTQSYTYFAWRNNKPEITQYFTELTQSESREYFRPNCWPNTPDILTEYLQFGGRPAFMARAVLAATLSAVYGIYGPAFELTEHEPREPGSEEYLNSEKYEIRHWDIERADSLSAFITRLNAIRKDNVALQSDWSLRFHTIGNEQMICYSKSSDDGANVILTVVNLDPYHTQSGWVELDLDALGVDQQGPYQVHELLSGARYLWHGARNFVQLDPTSVPAHIFRLRRRVRTERDFDYFL
jgi:starch synthase (maltosyl-transferring)